MALAIFDLDNTLIAGDSDHAWGEYLVENGIVDAALYKKVNDQFLLDYQSGKLDIQAYLEFALKPLHDNPLEKLYAWREDFFERKIKPIMLAKAIELIDIHRQKGDLLMIITATNRFVTEPIAKAFKVDVLIATDPEFIDQQYTGKVAGTPSFREGKITRLNEWLKGQPYTIEGAYFYSDSHNDIPLLKLVDRPVGVDPDDQLRATCNENDWPILSLRD